MGTLLVQERNWESERGLDRMMSLAQGPTAPLIASTTAESPARRRINSRGHAFAFFAGLLTSLYLQFGARIYLGEIVVVLFCVLGVLTGSLQWSRFRVETKAVISLGLVWLVAALISNIVNATPLPIAMRSIGIIGILLCAFVFALEWLMPSRNRLLWYAFGTGLSYVVVTIVQPTRQMETSPWRISIGVGVSILVMLFLVRYRQHYWIGVFVILGLSVVNLSLNSRGNAFALLATAVILALSARRRSLSIRPVLLAGLAVALAALVVYPWAAQNGVFGQQPQETFLSQQNLNENPVLAGRAKLVAGIAGVAENPVLGRGGNASVTPEDLDRVSSIGTSLGYSDAFVLATTNRMLDDAYSSDGDDTKTTAMLGHSMLLSGWVTDGVGGLAFWVGILVLITRGLKSQLAGARGLWPLALWLTFTGYQIVLFSPYGIRTWLPMILAFALYGIPRSVDTLRQTKPGMTSAH